MKKILSLCLCAALAAGLTSGLMGCGGPPPATPTTPAKVGDKTPPAGETHEHAHEGPHGGSLIELGEEEYHAELVHDEKAGTVTIYVLDSAAKAAVPIDAAEVTINLTHDGNAEQFKLAASADKGDPAGKASRFVSEDKELAEDLDKEGTAPQLVLEIAGKQFRGKIEHDHDHEEHMPEKK